MAFICISVVDCGSPIVMAPGSEGLLSTQTNTTFNSTVMYSCQTGYTFMGVAERTCQADGTYSNAQPNCTSG